MLLIQVGNSLKACGGNKSHKLSKVFLLLVHETCQVQGLRGLLELIDSFGFVPAPMRDGNESSYD